ncbi:MAG: 3-phosphoserine/phosphohydroxythreonine transaminase [Spirochaetes bacterium]|nr:3-phosphoserine/phosphohydroxythreonine transaminase [Spirochaetota bacterium]
MGRVYNFSAGPSMLPEVVLQRAAQEMLDYRGSGQSVMEMSHRSHWFEEIIQEAEALLRELMGIPDTYAVLFLQGGASLQFSMVPLNLLPEGGVAEYVETGHWAAKAAEEAARYGTIRITASSRDRNYSYIPNVPSPGMDAAYLHITTNNTIYGTRFTRIPETGSVPLVADMSSNILSEPIDIGKFGLVYAGAQKNLGPAGVTVVIIRKDLVGRHRPITPTMLRYDIHVENHSLYNTPPCYSIYILKLVLEEVKRKGGVEEMYRVNLEKARILYDFLDQSRLFRGTVDPSVRSLMNVPFVTGSKELDALFLKEAEARGFINLKGHRTVGGMRASIYNAMPVEGVKALVSFMKEFEAKHGKGA